MTPLTETMNPATAVTWGPFIQAAYDQYTSDPAQVKSAGPPPAGLGGGWFRASAARRCIAMLHTRPVAHVFKPTTMGSIRTNRTEKPAARFAARRQPLSVRGANKQRKSAEKRESSECANASECPPR